MRRSSVVLFSALITAATASASTVSLIPPGTPCSGVIGSNNPFTSVPPATQPAGGDATFNLADAPGLVALGIIVGSRRRRAF